MKSFCHFNEFRRGTDSVLLIFVHATFPRHSCSWVYQKPLITHCTLQDSRTPEYQYLHNHDLFAGIFCADSKQDIPSCSLTHLWMHNRISWRLLSCTLTYTALRGAYIKLLPTIRFGLRSCCPSIAGKAPYGQVWTACGSFLNLPSRCDR